MSYFADNTEWQWLFKNAIKWDQILPLYYPNYPTEDELGSPEEVLDFMGELLSTTGDWCQKSVEPRAVTLDQVGAGTVKDGRTIPSKELEELYSDARELGAFGINLPREFGGMETPGSAGMIMLAQLSRACMSSSTQVAFFSSIADMIDRFGDDEDRERLIPQIIEGSLSGSMCLTEPECGSDLGAIKTIAAAQEDGTYLINGTKIFITNAGGGIGLVLAKVKGEEDNVNGLSLFLVEQDHPKKEGNNFEVVKNEEKMGLHGSFTCMVTYENTIGKLIGKKNEGFKYMLHLMNEARIAVGMQALGGIENCLDYARKYADERIAFDKPISQLPLLKRNLEDFETERDAIRALLVDTCSHYDIFQRLDLKKRHTGELTKDESQLFKDASLWVRKRTPLVKYYACEQYTTLSQKAIQVLGGFGFMQEYPVERVHRDSFAPLLYEGTSQIQALMALKDVIKYAIKDPKKFFSNIFYKHPTLRLLNNENDWSKKFKSTHYKFKKKMIKLLFQSLRPENEKLLDLKNWANIDEDKIGNLMIHAETLCQALSYMETLRVLCEHANTDSTRSDLFNRYLTLITPRLEAVYSDWEIRS